MKKITLLVLAAIRCFPVLAQQTEGIEVSAVARADVSPSFPGGEVNFDNSALYTFIDGAFGQHFSYSISNHWLSTTPGQLYTNSWRTDESTWLDWANISCELGNWTISLGKDCIPCSGYEMQPNDVDNHSLMCSSFWNGFSVYQWGGRVYFAPGDSEFMAAVSSSPYSGRPFKEGLITCSLQWTGEYDVYRPLWSANMVQTAKGEKPLYLVTLGNEFDLGNWTLGVDGMVRGFGGTNLFKQKGYVLGSATYRFCDAFEAKLRGGWEYNRNDFPDSEEDGGLDLTYLPQGNSGFCTGVFHWYPLKESEALRVHAVGSYSWINKIWTLSFGVTYNLDIIGLFDKR